MTCEHCNNGFLNNKYGQDVECVNGVLIDIDEYTEGWARDTLHPVAPCHPMWERQCAGDDDFPNDTLERLEATIHSTSEEQADGS